MITKEDKDAMIAKLEESKKTLPEFSVFNNPNWEIIDGQILVIQEDMTEEDVHEEFGEEFDENDEQDEKVRDILIAVSWLEGGVDASELVDE